MFHGLALLVSIWSRLAQALVAGSETCRCGGCGQASALSRHDVLPTPRAAAARALPTPRAGHMSCIVMKSGYVAITRMSSGVRIARDWTVCEHVCHGEALVPAGFQA